MQDYILIIAEKPTAARRIAEALAEKGTLKKKVEDGNVAYYEFLRNGEKHVVVSAVGHLFNLDAVEKRWKYPVFEAEWRPSFLVRKEAAFSRKYFKVLEKLVKNAKDFIVATDYDTEGSVIGMNILRFIAGVKDGKRMKFSTLTKQELINAYENLQPHLDFHQIEAGLARHEMDWLWGINLSRALTLALKNNGKKGFAILSTGRVQGPTLAILAKREEEIRKFKPKPYWQIEAKISLENRELVAKYEKDKIWSEKEAKKIFKECKVKEAKVLEVKKRKYKQNPPTPFNTTDLQTEAYNMFKFSPSQTLNIAETLYQEGYISYPRSASQKLPESIGYERILQALSNLPQYSSLCSEILKQEELSPVQGRKDDPAHPAIYPTSEPPDLKKLTPQQRKLYDLIVRRFLAVFATPALRETCRIKLDLNGHKFILVGKRTLEEGWMKFYSPYISLDEIDIPEMKVGESVRVLKINLLKKQTQPPARYTQGSIIKEMEKRNLGTRATRAEILKTLYDRGYVVGKSIKVTKLGEGVVKTLKKHCPTILSEELTRRFEKEMELILLGKKKREAVIEEAKKSLRKILRDFKKNEKKIGEALGKALMKAREEERKLGVCPNCGKELRIIKSRKSGLFFVGCSGYPECTTSYPLPRNSRIEFTGKICEKCKTPIIMVFRKGKRPFRMCLDPNCPTKAKWRKKKER